MSLVPRSIKKRIKERFLEAIPPLGSNQILASLYSPPILKPAGSSGWNSGHRESAEAHTLPLPPLKLRMGHSSLDADYLAHGARSERWIRQLLDREHAELQPGDAIMDWGCASGRVLRHFKREAEAGVFCWGVDESTPCLTWNRENLSPPFNFLTSTAYPHLPFEDNTFKLVYALSVFTHIVHLWDVWLMEFRRILIPGGLAFFTIHEEHTWRRLAEDPAMQNTWVTNRWLGTDFSLGPQRDVEISQAGDNWGGVTVFYKENWIRAEWGRYFEVVSIEPLCEAYQATVVLRKRKH
jgi:SAM-dependent methyltransferase